MIAVCDMGPLHYLVLIGCDHILPRIFERVITARIVIEHEMADPNTPELVRRWAANPPQWLEVLEPQQIEAIPSLGKQGVRGDGDRAIISLARELAAPFPGDGRHQGAAGSEKKGHRTALDAPVARGSG